MLRADGTYVIYLIQHDYYGNGKWATSNFDSFGAPPHPKYEKGMVGTLDCFSAVGKCWQQTGIMGVFDLEIAKEGLEWIRKKNPAMKFRLVASSVSQATIPLTY